MDLPVGSSYEEIYDKFRWQIPDYFNIADAVCDRWAQDPTRVAISHEARDGSTRDYTFTEIRDAANQLANLLEALEVRRGDRLLVMLTQSPECAIAHMACFKSGIVSCLASVLFGPDAIQHRLQGSGARVCITNGDNLDKVRSIREQCPD
ncbi:MAG: AMP-binding protein, partial [Luminiphilus sp.]